MSETQLMFYDMLLMRIGGRSVGVVRSPTQTMEFVCFDLFC
jgi:hypothetical protein